MSYLKSKPIRSKALRESARGQPCSLRLPGCDGGGETTVLAHLPYGGRGMGLKAPDYHAVHACNACHASIDGRTKYIGFTPQDLMIACIRGHAETMQRWIDDGLITIKGAA